MTKETKRLMEREQKRRRAWKSVKVTKKNTLGEKEKRVGQRGIK